MRVLFVGIEFGIKTGKVLDVLRASGQFSGRTFEYDGMYRAMKSIPGVDAEFFPLDRLLDVGRDRMNKELLAKVRREKPDLVFFVPYSDELNKNVLKKISEVTKTVAWFSDDHWRFDNYSRYIAPYFDWVITTYSRAVERYKKVGVNNIILSQWAADTSLYKPTHGAGSGSDVSFVGTWSRPRKRIISDLQSFGISVDVYGDGWQKGSVSRENMIKIFSESKINLGLNSPPGFLSINSLGRIFSRRSFNQIVLDFRIVRNFRTFLKRGIPQIKARHFEIPACGGFLMTANADNLGDYYEIGKEIVVYDSVSDMADKINYYLNHEEERTAIAEAGYQRTIRDHTYEKRFEEIFNRVGFTV